MRNFKMILAATLLAVCTTASAQFSNQKGTNSTNGWSTLWVQWNPSNLTPDKGDSESFTGLSLGYSKAFSASSNVPIFIEAGIGVQYSFSTIDVTDDDDDDVSAAWQYWYGSADGCIEKKTSMLSAKVPVSFMYDWQIPNSSVAITPYAGLDLRFNIIGKSKYEIPGEYWEREETHNYIKNYDDEILEDANIFDKDDMGGKDFTWKRLQVGWHIGVNARFDNKFLVGISYGQDVSEIVKDTKIHTTSITLGYCF